MATDYFYNGMSKEEIESSLREAFAEACCPFEYSHPRVFRHPFEPSAGPDAGGPGQADTDGSGELDMEEFAAYLQARVRRRASPPPPPPHTHTRSAAALCAFGCIVSSAPDPAHT